MAIIKFRTKIEVFVTFSFLLILAIFSVVSINRIISDSGDNIETLIRNTNGNIWEPTGANLQEAIDDLRGIGGTVWVGSSLTISSEIKIENSVDNIIIDFQGNSITTSSSVISFINLTNASHVTVKNLFIRPHKDSTASLIKLYIDPSGGSTSHNTFNYINVKNQGGRKESIFPGGSNWNWVRHNFTVIEMKLNGPGEINNNAFINIYAEGVGKGVYFNQLVGESWINATYVDGMFLDQHRECIRFNHLSGNRSFNFNRFCNVKTQACVWTEYGITNISGYGNHFDHILIWDWYVCAGGSWSNTGVYEYYITSDADSTYLQLHAYYQTNNNYFLNNGKNTMMIGHGKIRIGG